MRKIYIQVRESIAKIWERPLWAILGIASLPYFIAVGYFLAKSSFMYVASGIITYSRELLLLISTSLLIKNGISLHVAKKEYGQSVEAIAELKEKVRAMEKEMRELVRDGVNIDRNLSNIRKQQAEMKVKIKIYESIILPNNENEKNKI
jgi:hypothetical protein